MEGVRGWGVWVRGEGWGGGGGITGGGMSVCIVRWQCVICLGLVPPPPSFFWRYWPFDIGSLSGLGHVKTEVAERERLSGEFLPRFDKTFRGKQKYIYIYIWGGGGGGGGGRGGAGVEFIPFAAFYRNIFLFP